MKLKAFVTLMLVLVCFAWSQSTVKFLKMEVPAETKKGKKQLAIDVKALEALVQAEGAGESDFNIDMANLSGKVLANLGSVDKGKIKWLHKVADKTNLMAEFSDTDYPDLVDKVNKKAPKPGLQLLFRHKVSGIALKTIDITLAELPDLKVGMEYPIQNKPGNSLAGKISIKVENIGVAPARDFAVEVVLSADDQIPVKKAVFSENFSDDVLIKDGRVEIPVLEPGKSVQVNIDGAAKLADDAGPGKYYLAAVVDPENKVAEINEDNNVTKGVLSITVPAPKKVTIDFPETTMTFEPEGQKFKIESQGIVLGDDQGGDWRRCRTRADNYQLMHTYWKDFYWIVDTYNKIVYEVREGEFCKKIGRIKNLKIKMLVKGGSFGVAPKSFTLIFPQTQIVYEREERKFSLLMQGNNIGHLQLWRICPAAPHLFQLQYKSWTDFFLEVDTFKNEVRKVTNVGFCKEGKGTSTVVSKNIKVEY